MISRLLAGQSIPLSAGLAVISFFTAQVALADDIDRARIEGAHEQLIAAAPPEARPQSRAAAQPQPTQRICCRIKQKFFFGSSAQCDQHDGEQVATHFCEQQVREDRQEEQRFKALGGIVLKGVIRELRDGKAKVAGKTPRPPLLEWKQTAYHKPAERLPRAVTTLGLRGGIASPAAVKQLSDVVVKGLPEGVALKQDKAKAVTVGSVRRVRRGLALGESRQNKLAVSYQMEYQGVPFAKHSSTLALVEPGGTVEYTRTRNVPRLIEGLEPTVPAQDARKTVWKRLEEELTTKHEVTKEDLQTVGISEPNLEIFTEPDGTGRLAWALTARYDKLSVPIVRQYWIGAIGEPEILHAQSLILHASGQVTGQAWRRTPSWPTHTVALPFVSVRRGGQTVEADSKGEFDIEGEGPITVELTGAAARIVNDDGNPLTLSRSVDASGPLNLNFASASETELAQVSAYYWTTRVRDFFTQVLDQSQLVRMKVHVNKWGAPCNAFYDPQSRGFGYFKAPPTGAFGDGGSRIVLYGRHGQEVEVTAECQNTAVGGVIAHEMGHALHHVFNTNLYEDLDIDADAEMYLDTRSLSEGFGDAIAVLFFRTPCIAPGIVPGSCMRYADNDLSWTDPRVRDPDQPYVGGIVFAGFVWDLIERLQTKYRNEDEDKAFQIAANLVLDVIALDPASIPDAVCSMIDVDQKSGNSTLHFNELREAAVSRDLPFPASASAPPEERMALCGGNGS